MDKYWSITFAYFSHLKQKIYDENKREKQKKCENEKRRNVPLKFISSLLRHLKIIFERVANCDLEPPPFHFGNKNFIRRSCLHLQYFGINLASILVLVTFLSTCTWMDKALACHAGGRGLNPGTTKVYGAPIPSSTPDTCTLSLSQCLSSHAPARIIVTHKY